MVHTQANDKANAFGLSYAVTSVLSALLVVLKESNEGVHNVLTSMTGHHWVSHGVLDIVLFVVLGFVFGSLGIKVSPINLLKTVVGATVLSGLIIVGYFV